jgi:hypothetical protein
VNAFYLDPTFTTYLHTIPIYMPNLSKFMYLLHRYFFLPFPLPEIDPLGLPLGRGPPLAAGSISVDIGDEAFRFPAPLPIPPDEDNTELALTMREEAVELRTV